MFRKLWHHFQPGDVVLNDRAYCTYVDFVRLRERGVFCVSRLHQKRKINLRSGQRLGHDDWQVTWRRPEQWIPSCGVSEEGFEQLPETLEVRIVRITQIPRGFRSRPVWVATTLLDPLETPADEIRALYRDRWTAELNFRSLKIGLGLDILRGRSVNVVSKEIVMHLVAYNLIRLLMWHAAAEHGRDLHRLSFTGRFSSSIVRWPIRFASLRPHCARSLTTRCLIGPTGLNPAAGHSRMSPLPLAVFSTLAPVLDQRQE